MTKLALVVAASLSLHWFVSSEFSLEETPTYDCVQVEGRFPNDRWRCCDYWADGKATDCREVLGWDMVKE